MAELSFHGIRTGSAVTSLAGSGVGFFGSTFGSSVQTGSYQDTSFITNSNGTAQGPQLNNHKYTTGSGLEFNGASVSAMLFTPLVPNQSGTLNVRFLHDTAVMTQNAVLQIFDRITATAPASGVECRVAELRHPWNTFSPIGSGGSWVLASESAPTPVQNIVSCFASPGMSGHSPNGPTTSSTRHDWYFLLSASPESIGSKTAFGLYFALEYL